MDKLETLKKAKAEIIQSFVPTNEFLAKFITSQFGFEEDGLDEIEVLKVLEDKKSKLTVQMQKGILNEKEAFLKIFDMAKQGEDMDEKHLKDIHAILLKDLNPLGGLYRQVNISVKGSSYIPPHFLKVYDKMNKYFVETLNPFGNLYENISYAHLQLTKVRPFIDANGRLARIVLNYHLIKNGFLPIVINHKKPQEYFALLEEFKVQKNIKPFVEYLIKEEALVLEAL